MKMKKMYLLILGLNLIFIPMSAQKKKAEKNTCTQKVVGTVFRNATQNKVKYAFVQLKDRNSRVLKSFKTDRSAKYFFELECSKRYAINASSKNYETSQRVVISTSKDKLVGKKDMFLNTKLKNGEKRDYLFKGSVDFDYNEWKLLPRYKYDLDKAVLLMKANPRLVIHFESHTDSRATPEFNMDLCDKRIEVLKEYLGFKEIFRKRISGKAYGETKPLNRCVKGVQCNDEEYLENRRTIFILKEKK